MGKGTLDPDRQFLNKWEMYKALHGEDIGPCELPVTAFFQRESLREFVEVYGTVFVKPVDSWGGRGITLVEKRDGMYLCRQQGGPKEEFPTLDALVEHLLAACSGSACIVQQAAPLVTIEGRPFDIRVHLQREMDGTWVEAGTLIRVSGRGGIVSNVGISNGRVLTMEEGLRQAFPDEKDMVSSFTNKYHMIGEKIRTVLEPYRHFHEIGIDLGADAGGGLWLIEVNTDDAVGAPSHDLFAQLPDQAQYREMRRRLEDRTASVLQMLMGWLEELGEAE